MEDAERREQLERMMEAHGTPLLRMCAVYLRDAHQAQDAVQETFLKAYRRMDDFRGECSEKTWLTGIAINVCRDYRRAAWFRHVERREDLDALRETPAPDADADDTVLSEVTRLPRRYREAVLLRYYQGLKLKETAEALQISNSAVKQRLKRANAILRERLKEWYFNEE